MFRFEQILELFKNLALIIIAIIVFLKAQYGEIVSNFDFMALVYSMSFFYATVEVNYVRKLIYGF